MDSPPTSTTSVPPEPFTRQVKDALAHLFDLSYLQRHPLAAGIEFPLGSSPEPPGQRLRRELAAAVEAFNPGPAVPFHSPSGRLYNLVRLRYVEGFTVRETASELGLSLRQAHRDLRHAEESVAAVLWARSGMASTAQVNGSGVSSFEMELARLDVCAQLADLRASLQRACAAVAAQAEGRGVGLELHLPPEPVAVYLDPVVADQVLVNSLSYAIRQAYPGGLSLSLRTDGAVACVQFQYFTELATGDGPVVDLSVVQLADRLGWYFGQEDGQDGRRTLTLHIPCGGPTVLVVDDNSGLVELLQRYLTDQACHVVAAADGETGLRLAEELDPVAIVLDLMMPTMHGWELLQRLRASPRNRTTPVIVCSVINNPELAQSLGANLFLPKPVSRVDVLEALRKVGAL